MQKRLQFSILTLLGVTLATALLTGWLTNKPLGEGMGRVVLNVALPLRVNTIPRLLIDPENIYMRSHMHPEEILLFLSICGRLPCLAGTQSVTC